MASELANRVAIVTGGSHGLGKEIARAFLRAGAQVLICARNEADLSRAARDIPAGLPPQAGRLVSHVADVSRADDARGVVAAAIRQFGALHVLVNNAGIHGPKGMIDEVPWEAWVEAISVNLLGSAAMARAVLPHFKSQRYGKIIQVSGGGATRPIAGMSPYAASKAAVVRFAETLALEGRPYGIDVNSMAPGALNTRLLDDVLEAGAAAVGADAIEKARRQKAQGGTPLEVPARLAVFLASARSDGITGKLIAAVWDDWEAFPSHLPELDASDVYTLRRIVAKDRGFSWGDK